MGPFALWRWPEKTDRRHQRNRKPDRPGERALRAHAFSALGGAGMGLEDGHSLAKSRGSRCPRKAQEHTAEHVSREHLDGQ